MNKEYRMPDGTWSKDALKMSRAWARIYKPICKEFNVTTIGYDPGIRFSYGSSSFDLPTDVAIKVRDLIIENKRMDRELNGY